ncbi:hypothetical protein EB809_18745 [Marinobacter sp. R17]|nr:hypothetical protein EB809_18745 [Marinobacter sp. R17]
MEFFGYTEELQQAKHPAPSKLPEVTISASPSELRAVAQFLIEAADSIEAQGAGFEHEHFPRNTESDPDLVVFNAEASW